MCLCVLGKVPSCEHLAYKGFLWGGGYRNCFRHYHHVKHQRKGEGDLVTDLLWQSRGGLLIAAESCALFCQPQHHKALSEHLNLSRKTLEDEHTHTHTHPPGGVLGFSDCCGGWAAYLLSVCYPFR